MDATGVLLTGSGGGLVSDALGVGGWGGGGGVVQEAAHVCLLVLGLRPGQMAVGSQAFPVSEPLPGYQPSSAPTWACGNAGLGWLLMTTLFPRPGIQKLLVYGADALRVIGRWIVSLCRQGN